MDVIAKRWRERGVEVVAPREVTDEQLARIHESGHHDEAGDRARTIRLNLAIQRKRSVSQ